MIISKTPFRISFFGGGTDFPDYYNKYGGKVIGGSIDKYCYISIREHHHSLIINIDLFGQKLKI